jgi:hypothetical protein
MKRIILLISIFSFLNGFTQDFSEKEIAKLNKLNIKTESLNLNDFNIQKDLNEILNLERKRKTNKTFGIILTTLSLATITAGIIEVSKKNDLNQTLGTVGIVAGIIEGGISIPLWKSSKKRKKERDELLKKFE